MCFVGSAGLTEAPAGTLIQRASSTRKLEMTKAVMALEPKMSQGRRSHFPADVSLRRRMSMSE